MTPHAYTRTDAIKTHPLRAKSSRTESHRLTRVQNDASNLLRWGTANSKDLLKCQWYLLYKHSYIILYLPVVPHKAGGGSFKNRKPIGEIGCCESGMAERIHWWTERCLRSPLFLSLSLTIYLPIYLLSIYLSIDRSIYLSLSLFHLITYLSIYLSLSLSFICLSV